MKLQAGRLLGQRYRIIEEVGSGGFGTVYRAVDNQMWQQTVAVKISTIDTAPAPSQSEQERLQSRLETARRQFEEEARLLYGLRYPSLPRVTDYFVDPDHGQVMVMDFIEGLSLAALLAQRGGPLPEAEALYYTRQVAAALSYLHSRTPPILHRDLKPANVILTADNQLFLVDFGIAKIDLGPGQSTYAQRGVSAGYSPLEQYSRLPTSARSDLYALAATLYRLLTYAGEEDGTLPDAPTRAVQPEAFRPPAAHNPEVSEPTSRAVMWAMALAAEERPAGVAEWLAQLPQLPYTPLVAATPGAAVTDFREATEIHLEPSPADEPVLPPPGAPTTPPLSAPTTPPPSAPTTPPPSRPTLPPSRPALTPGPKSKLPVAGQTWLGRYSVERLGRDHGPILAFVAQDAVLRQRVALWLWVRNYRDPGAVHKQLSRHEALRHAAIATVLAHGNSDGHGWLAFPELTGAGPAGWPDARLPLADVLPLAGRLAAALDHAHSHGIVHGDVRPKHIRFDDAGQAYLAFLDPHAFIASACQYKMVVYDDEMVYQSGLERIGKVLGGAPGDIVALALLLLRLLSGVSLQGYFVALAKGAPAGAALEAARRALPEPVGAVFDRALRSEARERYPTAAALVEALRRAGEEPATAPPPAATRPPTLAATTPALPTATRPPRVPVLPLDATFQARYHVLVLLADDGDSQTFLARDSRRGHKVALRVWPRPPSPDFDDRLGQLARLKHWALAGIIDRGAAQRLTYAATPHLPGGSLADRLANGPLTAETTAAIVYRIVGALDAVHRQGLLYGRLTPHSILFDSENRAWLSVYDIHPDQADIRRNPWEHTHLDETSPYSSPEAAASRRLDPRSDVYSLGAILFEMLAGRPPFPTGSGAALVEKFIGRAPTPADQALELKLMHLAAPVPPLPAQAWAQPVLNQALAKAPDDRFGSALALGEALRRARQTGGK